MFVPIHIYMFWWIADWHFGESSSVAQYEDHAVRWVSGVVFPVRTEELYNCTKLYNYRNAHRTLN